MSRGVLRVLKIFKVLMIRWIHNVLDFVGVLRIRRLLIIVLQDI